MVMAALIGACLEGSTKGKTMNPQIRYWSNAVNNVYPLTLEISDSLVATLVVGCDSDVPGKAGVGMFTMKLEASQVEPLVNILSSPKFAAVKDPGPAFPGAEVHKLSIVTEEHGEILKYITESAPADSAFLEAENRVRKLLPVILRHAEYAIAIHHFSIAQGKGVPDSLEIVLDIVNTGAKSINLYHPNLWGTIPNALELTALRNDVPLADLRSQHQAFFSIQQEHLLDLNPVVPDSDRVVLQAGRHLTLRYGLELYLEPGSYDVTLSLQTPIFADRGSEILACEVFSTTGKLTR